MPNDWLKNELLKLESVYQSGNLGALKDAVYWCRHYQYPLPEWANIAIFETLNALAMGDNKSLKNWAAWFRQYKQDRADYELYSAQKEAREHNAEWIDSYSIAGSILTNKHEGEQGHKKGETVKKTYQKVNRQIETEPHRYFQLKTFQKRNDCPPYRKDLWVSIQDTIKDGKPKGIKNR